MTYQTIQVKRTKYTEHCYRSKDKHISQVLLWTPTYGHTSVAPEAKIYIHQLCADIECRLEDLPRAIADMNGWRQKINITSLSSRTDSTTWWWWCCIWVCVCARTLAWVIFYTIFLSVLQDLFRFCYIYIYIYIYIYVPSSIFNVSIIASLLF